MTTANSEYHTLRIPARLYTEVERAIDRLSLMTVPGEVGTNVRIVTEKSPGRNVCPQCSKPSFSIGTCPSCHNENISRGES